MPSVVWLRLVTSSLQTIIKPCAFERLKVQRKGWMTAKMTFDKNGQLKEAPEGATLSVSNQTLQGNLPAAMDGKVDPAAAAALNAGEATHMQISINVIPVAKVEELGLIVQSRAKG